MRKNHIWIPKMPNSRNDFIDCLKEETEVIVISNHMIEVLSKEINENIENRKAKKLFTAIGTGAILLTPLNPLAWLMFAAGRILQNEIKKYKVYKGQDVENKQIFVLVHKNKVDTKLDTIDYDPTYVLSVDAKAHKGYIKL